MQHTEKLIEAYENHAQERAGYSVSEFKRKERGEFLGYVKEASGESLLEIGCGPGKDAEFFQREGLRVLAVDLTPAMVGLARERGIDARVLDCYDLDRIDGTFDAVYSLNCLLHVPQKDIGGVFASIADRLNENGLMYLGLWGGNNFEGILEEDSYEPKRFFSFMKAETLLKELRPYFRLEYYRRLEPREDMPFNSVIVRKY